MNINSETLRPAAQRLWERNQNLNFILREAVGIVVFKKGSNYFHDLHFYYEKDYILLNEMWKVLNSQRKGKQAPLSHG